MRTRPFPAKYRLRNGTVTVSTRETISRYLPNRQTGKSWEAFDRFPVDEHVLLYIYPARDWTVDLDDACSMRHGLGFGFPFRFGTLNFVVNGRRFSWGAQTISVALI
jgi:hypothetical protein